MNRSASSVYQNTVPTLAFMAGGLMGGAIACYQCYTYVQFGVWVPLSVIDGLRWLGVQWSFMPERWVGAYQLLRAFPLCLAAILLGSGPYLVTLLSTNRGDRDSSI
jgi:hypothetical protein